MTKIEFGKETERWYRGAGRIDDLTPERLMVLWEQYGSLALNVWRNAISKALLEPRWPSSERMDALVGKAEDYEEMRAQRERNLEAQRAMRGGSGYGGLVSGMRASDEYGRKCKALTEAVLQQHLSPAQTAELLAIMAGPTLTLGGMDVRPWHDALVAAGVDWSAFNLRGEHVRSERRTPTLGLDG